MDLAPTLGVWFVSPVAPLHRAILVNELVNHRSSSAVFRLGNLSFLH